MAPAPMLTNKQIALLNNGIAFHKAGRWTEASQAYAQVRAQAPDEPGPWYMGGLAALQLRRPNDAITLLERAIRLSPKNHEYFYHLGIAYTHASRHAEAEKHLRTAIALKADYVDAWLFLGSVLQVLNRIGDALDAFQTAAKLRPERADVWYNIGICQSLLGLSADAVKSHDKAIEIDPQHANAYYGRSMARQQTHMIREAIADYDKHLIKQPHHREALSYRLFAFNYLSEHSRDFIYQEHVKFGKIFETPEQLAANAARRFNGTVDPNRRLRIGFLSPDLRIHSVAFFLQPIVANLDKDKFEIYLYHDHYKEDAFSEVLRRSAKKWKNFVGIPDAKLEAAIRSDDPDVMVDLAGHTGMNRLPLFARRLAPVQITYLGYPNTTGLQSMDYRFTDGIADPKGEADAFYTEKQIRFSSTAWCFWPPLGSPEPAIPPCMGGAPIVFGCFNSLSKISADTVDLWSRILLATPDSRLLLKSVRSGERDVVGEFQAKGIAPGRIVQIPSTSAIIEHLDTYSKMDIALDPYPYHGTTTTCEALWMGIPIVSLRGDRHASRVSSSLLTAVGRPEWIATSADDYVAKATALAADRPGLAQIRSTLRGQMQASPILDAKGQAERFGDAVRDAWKHWCASRG
ncbi:MAG: tetratricopeptide repeat protein [Opitutaceae bacterium]|jgi:predicted O-linked N-acetylglucosamine transferase (SPINDLY family)